MSYFRYLLSSDTFSVISLYNSILLVSFLVGSLSQRKITLRGTIKLDYKFRPIAFYITFLLLWFFLVLNKTGSDLQQYIYIYNSSVFNIDWIICNKIEVGFRFLNAVLHHVITDAYVGIGIIKTVSLFLFFLSLYKMKDDIDIGVAILFYVSVFYFYSFSAIRSTLAGSLCILSSVLLYKGKNVKSLILSLSAVTIHSSAILHIITLLGFGVYRLFRILGKKRKFIMIVSIPIIVSFGTTIINYFINNINLFPGRYSTKYMTYGSSFGVGQLAHYLPIFILMIYASKCFVNRRMLEHNFIWTITGFIIAMIGYDVGMISRAAIYFYFPFVIFMPFYIKAMADSARCFIQNPQSPTLVLGMNYNQLKAICILYCLFRYVLTLSGVFYSSAIYEFRFIWQ